MRSSRLRKVIGSLIGVGGLLTMSALAAAQSSQILINQLEDYSLGTWSGSGNMALTLQHCVGPTTGTFRVTAQGSGAGGAFILSNGLSTLPFRVEYRGRDGGFQQLATGVPLTGLQGDALTQCVNLRQQRERLRITVLAADLTVATAGTYNGSLTLTVAPE